MDSRRVVATVGWVVLVVLVVGVVAGQVLGQPVFLAFVETGSMSPTLEPGDGFVAVPTAVAGPIEEGDVVVFEAEQIHDGGLVTHRVVGETPHGFLTRGDANPFTDQDDGEPPVKRARIVAVAPQPGGNVIAIPYLGTLASWVRGSLAWLQGSVASVLGTSSFLGTQVLGYLLFALSLGWYALDRWREGDRDRRTRDRSRDTGTDARLLVGGFAALVVLAATAAMVVPAGTQEIGIVSTEGDGDSGRLVPVGGERTYPYHVVNDGLVPVEAYVEPASDGVEVDRSHVRLTPGQDHNVSVTLSAPPQTGYYRRYVTQHRYLALLPTGVTDWLHDRHPWAPILAIDLLLGVPFYLLGIRLVGTGRVRRRSRSGHPARP